MTTVWLLRKDTTHFNSLSLKARSKGVFPRLDGTPELETWNPQEVWYHPLDFNENKGIASFPSWGTVNVCDAKAKQIISGLVDDHVEFLPLIFHKGAHPESSATTGACDEYYAINPVTILDCLDHERSEFSSFGPLKKIGKYVFKPDCIREIPIFILPISKRTKLFVTDAFKQLIEDYNLTGLEFKKVWEE